MQHNYLEIKDTDLQVSFSWYLWFCPQKELGSVPSSMFEVCVALMSLVPETFGRPP